MPNDNYLETSPYASDGGQQIGRHPRDVPVSLLKQLGGPTSASKAIRAKCIDCCGGQLTEVRKCVAIHCALWPFRMGHSPFYGHADDEAATPTASDRPNNF
jgi:hypothetical protein